MYIFISLTNSGFICTPSLCFDWLKVEQNNVEISCSGVLVLIDLTFLPTAAGRSKKKGGKHVREVGT